MGFYEQLPKNVQKRLEKIAMQADPVIERRGGIDDRYNDDDDFPEVSIRSMQEMLAMAYMSGANSKSKRR